MDTFVVLDRIEPGQTPDYCIHGRVTCAVCRDWCWLGSETFDQVNAGRVSPVCHQCVARLVPPGTRRVGRIDDHRRADGPHR